MAFPATGLTLRQLILLRIVWSDGPASGSDLRPRLDEALDTDRVYQGVFYKNLDELVEHGLVDKSEVDGRTNEYAVTGAGEQLLWDVSSWFVED